MHMGYCTSKNPTLIIISTKEDPKKKKLNQRTKFVVLCSSFPKKINHLQRKYQGKKNYQLNKEQSARK